MNSVDMNVRKFITTNRSGRNSPLKSLSFWGLASTAAAASEYNIKKVKIYLFFMHDVILPALITIKRFMKIIGGINYCALFPIILNLFYAR